MSTVKDLISKASEWINEKMNDEIFKHCQAALDINPRLSDKTRYTWQRTPYLLNHDADLISSEQITVFDKDYMEEELVGVVECRFQETEYRIGSLFTFQNKLSQFP